MLSKPIKNKNKPSQEPVFVPPSIEDTIIEESNEIIRIQPIECFNDTVALIQFHNDVGVPGMELPDDAKYGTTGIIVGVGPGLPSGDGRVPLHCKVGDTVVFYEKSPKEVITAGPKSFYAGKRVIFMIERSLICKSAIQRKFVIVEG